MRRWLQRLFRRDAGVHFDGEPSTFAQMHRLFAESNFVPGWRVIHAEPDDRKFRLTRLKTAVDQWKKRYAA